MAEQILGQVEAQAQNAFEQVELRDERQVEPRRDAAGNLEHRHQHAEQQDEHQAPQEIGDGERRAIGDVDAGLDRRAALARADDRQRPADRHGDEQRHDAELKRRRQPVHHQAEHVLPERDRGAEIAMRHAGQPDEELLEQRFVEAVERAQPVDVGLAGAGRQHHGDRIAGRDADHHEDHDRHAEQRDGHGQQADQEPCSSIIQAEHAIA